jgi:hypothetical protein
LCERGCRGCKKEGENGKGRMGGGRLTYRWMEVGREKRDVKGEEE